MLEKIDISDYWKKELPKKVSLFLHAFLEAYIIFYDEILLSTEKNELYDYCRRLDIEKAIKDMISWIIPWISELDIISRIFKNESFLNTFNDDYSVCTKNEFELMYRDCENSINSIFFQNDRNIEIEEILSYLRANVYKMVENIIDKYEWRSSDFWVDKIQIDNPELNRFLDALFNDNEDSDVFLINWEPNLLTIIKEQDDFKLWKDNQWCYYLIFNSDTYVLWKNVKSINSRKIGVITILYNDWTNKIIDLS